MPGAGRASTPLDDPYVAALNGVRDELRDVRSLLTAAAGQRDASNVLIADRLDRLERWQTSVQAELVAIRTSTTAELTAIRATLDRIADIESAEAKAEVEERGWFRHQVDKITTALQQNPAMALTMIGAIGTALATVATALGAILQHYIGG